MKLLKYGKKYIPVVILAFISAGISAVSQVAIPYYIGKAIDTFAEYKEFNRHLFINGLIIVFYLTVAAAIFTFIMNVANNFFVYKLGGSIRKRAYNSLSGMPVSEIDRASRGDMVSRITVDVDQFCDGLLMGATQIFTGVITIISTIVIMFKMNVYVALIVVLLTPLSFGVASFISGKTHIFFKGQAEKRGSLTSYIDEMIGNEKVVKAYGFEEKSIKKFDELNEKLSDESFKATFYSSLVNPSTRFVNNVIYAAVAGIGAYIAITSGKITIGILVSFLSYANQYMKPFNEISNVLAEIQNAIACGNRVCRIIETKPEADKKGAVNLVDIMDNIPEDQRGDVSLSHVKFSYDKTRELLRDVNINVKPGMRVAIVGPTGCGKSTLINLLMRFYDTDNGSIKVHNKNIKDYTRESLRKSYGMVLQETWLKSGTVKDNLKYGAADATDEEIIKAAKITHADTFIRQLPNGYDTYLYEDGGSLSEGQKQLLCITRVMLKLPPMLILDEATSSIDTRTEIRIQKTFAKMMKNRTSFVVAHRLSTIRESDLILVMKDGDIVETGNHQSLMEKAGFYKSLYMSQFETKSDADE